MGFKVLKAANMKIADSWDIEPCRLIEAGRRFRDTYCLHQQGDECQMMEAVHTSETSVTSTRLHCAISQKALMFK
jgi:hypothetical protein